MQKLTDSYLEGSVQDNPITQFEVDQSQAVATGRKESQAIAIEQRQGTKAPDINGAYERYKESVIAAQAVDKPAGEGAGARDVTLTADDDFLPYLSDVESSHDMLEQQYQDDQSGNMRPEGQVSNQYLLPGKKTIMGVDVANDQRIMDRGDQANGAAQEEYQAGREWIRQSNFVQGEGYDEKGLTGFTHIASGILEEGGDKAQFDRAVNMMGVPPEQARLAWNAAQSSRLQEDLAKAIVEDNFDQSTVQPPVPEDIDRADLPSVPMWSDAVKHVYEVEEGKPFEGDDEALIEYYTDMMTAFNWKTASANDVVRGVGGMLGLDTSNASVGAEGMAYWMVRAMQEDKKFGQALVHMIDTYERVNTDMEIVAESTMAALSDPLNIVSLGGGKIAMTIAGKLAKEKMKHWLAKGVVAGAGAGAVEGGVYSAADSAARQQINVEAGYQDEINKTDVAKAGAMGTAAGTILGAGLGVAMPLVGKGARRAGRTMWENGRKGSRMSPMRAQIGAVGNVGLPFTGPGAADRLGTRVPTSPKSTENPLTDPLVVGIKSLAQSDALEKNVKLMEQYEALRAHPDPKATVQERADFLKDQIKENLLWLHDQMDPELRARSKQWYDGARKQVDNWAKEYDVEPRQVAAMVAALSPQKDWFQNMSMAERILEVSDKFQDFQPNQAMLDTGDRIYSNDKPAHTHTANDRVKMANWNDIKNKTLGELNTDYEKALWIRAFDESNNSRSHRVWSPEGDMQEMALNNSGNELPTMWGSTSSIANAVAVLRDGSPQNISKAIGGQHKVRNFYNNIVAPGSERGEVTIDTHAVAAGLMEPHGGNAKEVSHNLGGGSGSALTGDAGTYGIFADAYREAAAERGVLAREMQSITWEEVRTIFDNKSDAMKKATKKVWSEYKAGKIDQQQAREKVDELARQASKSDSRDPAWAATAPGANEKARASSYEKELSGDGLPRRGSASDAGTDSGDTRRVVGERARRNDLRSRVYSTERPAWTGDAASRVYRGKGPGGDGEARGVKQVFDLKPGGKGTTYRNLLNKTDLPSDPVFHELEPTEMAATFQASLAESAANSPYGAAVTVLSPEEYATHRLFQSPDGKTGFSIAPDGEIGSVYSSGGGNVFSALQLAVEQGGTKLSAFETILPEIYEQAGFRRGERMDWDEKYAPDNWDKETFGDYNGGEPGVVEMEYDPAYFKLADEGIPATQALDISPEQKKTWQEDRKAKVAKDRETGKGRDPTVRYEAVEEAAKKLDAGDISLRQFKNVVGKVDPPPIAKSVTEVPTFEEIAQSVTKKVDDTGIIGLNVSVPVGEQVSSRLDIPAYRQYGTWIPTIHEPTAQGAGAGKVMGYGQAAHMTDVKFGTTPKDAMKVAQGSAKYPFSTMDGKWASNDPVAAQKQANKIVKKMDDKGMYTDEDGNEWVQVGMNPARSSGYYVKGEYNKLELLAGAEEVIQVGSVVIAKNPERVKLNDPEAAKKLGVKEGVSLFSLMAASLALPDVGEDTKEPEA